MELIDVIVFHCCLIFIVVDVIVVVDSCNEVKSHFSPKHNRERCNEDSLHSVCVVSKGLGDGEKAYS